jgi:putative membrane protein
MMMNLWLNFREDSMTNVHSEDKIAAMNLIIAYSVALKHHCREQPGFEYKDLVPYLPQDFVQSFDGATPQIAPLEIIKLFHQYIGMFEREGKLDGRTIGVLLSGANTFTDQLSNAERILTPWPLAYSIHLKVEYMKWVA